MKVPKIISFDYDFEHQMVKFNLNEGTIDFCLEELDEIKLEKKINYVSLLLFITVLGFLNYYAFELINTSTDHYLLILLNLVVFMYYIEIIYNPMYELKITKNENDNLFRIENRDVFLEFSYLAEYITKMKTH